MWLVKAVEAASVLQALVHILPLLTLPQNQNYSFESWNLVFYGSFLLSLHEKCANIFDISKGGMSDLCEYAHAEEADLASEMSSHSACIDDENLFDQYCVCMFCGRVMLWKENILLKL